MHHGPRRRVVQRALSECLSRVRLCGECDEQEFAGAVTDLPAVLRGLADDLECPPDDLCGCPEPLALEAYSLWAESYDGETGNEVVAGEQEVIWQIIGDPRGLRVLDVGCGTGRHAVPLAARGATVVALDPTPAMLCRAAEKAKAAGVGLDLRPGAIDDLDPELGGFDLVLCCLVLSHVDDVVAAVAALAQHVDPGGRLIVSDFHPFNLLLGFRTAFSSAGTAYVVPNHLHLPADYFSAMTAAGLTVTRLLEPGRWEKLPGVPPALVMEGQRPAT